jgi:hypothetical protein
MQGGRAKKSTMVEQKLNKKCKMVGQKNRRWPSKRGAGPGGPAVPQELAGAPAPRWTRPSGYMLGLGRPCFVLGCMHPKCIQHHFQWPQAAPPHLSPPPKKCKPPPAVLRSLPPAGVRPLKYPEVPRARLRRAPPDPAVPCPLPPLCNTAANTAVRRCRCGIPWVLACAEPSCGCTTRFLRKARVLLRE